MLAYYVERFTTVEINATFYRMPSARTVEGWGAAAPAGFTYVLKAPQRYFCDTARTLGDKLGPLLFQLPPNFKKATDRLGEVLSIVPDGFRAAFEFRHESWFDDEVYALLRSRNVALCIADTEEGTTPAIATADFGYLRLRAVEYTDGDLRRWIETIDAVGTAWRDAYVFFKHEAESTRRALAFQNLVPTHR